MSPQNLSQIFEHSGRYCSHLPFNRWVTKPVQNFGNNQSWQWHWSAHKDMRSIFKFLPHSAKVKPQGQCFSVRIEAAALETN